MSLKIVQKCEHYSNLIRQGVFFSPSTKSNDTEDDIVCMVDFAMGA